MYPRLTGASCLGGTSNTAVLGKVPTQACMRTLFPRHWDPAPRCAPRHAIGLRGRRVCHSVYVARGSLHFLLARRGGFVHSTVPPP
jgi:hypothetical protein